MVAPFMVASVGTARTTRSPRSEHAEKRTPVEPVRYRKTRINPRLDKNKVLIRDSQFMQDMLYTKYERWRYEEEIRVYSLLDHQTVDEQGHHYYECNDKLVLGDIYLGPECKDDIERFRELVTRGSCESLASEGRTLREIQQRPAAHRQH